jgi:hypothetical protein
MKRLFRWAYNGSSAVSAGLFVATCVVWMLSHHQGVCLLDRYPGTSVDAWYGELLGRERTPQSGFSFERRIRWRQPIWRLVVATSLAPLAWAAGNRRVLRNRLLQWALTGSSLMSAVLCLAAVAGWAWNGIAWLGDVGVPGLSDIHVYVDRGTLCFRTLRFDGELAGSGFVTVIFDQWQSHWKHLGFEFARGHHFDGRLRYITSLIGVPLWFVAVVGAAAPIWYVRGFYRKAIERRRAAAGHCPSCGYDLRATPERCPECGAVPAGKAAS